MRVIIPSYLIPLYLFEATRTPLCVSSYPHTAIYVAQGEAMGMYDSGSSLCRVVSPLLKGALVDCLGLSCVFWG